MRLTSLEEMHPQDGQEMQRLDHSRYSMTAADAAPVPTPRPPAQMQQPWPTPPHGSLDWRPLTQGNIDRSTERVYADRHSNNVPTQTAAPPATAHSSSNTEHHLRQSVSNRDLDTPKHQSTFHTGEAGVDYSAMDMDHHGNREPEGESDYLVGKALSNKNLNFP